MKKAILILSSALFFIGCGNNTDTKETTKDSTTATTEAPAETKDLVADAGLKLMSASDCFTCHKLTESSIGPAYAAVADKYKSMDKQAARDSIVHQIQHGSMGKWGAAAMQAHPQISATEADSMAVYIMSIKNN